MSYCTKKGNVVIPVIIGFSFILALGVFGAYFLKHAKPTKPLTSKPTFISVPTATPNSYPREVTVTGGECINNSLGLSITVPGDWICKSTEHSNVDGWISITSDVFTINISNLGRGPYCGDGPTTPTNICKTSKMPLASKVDTWLYNYNGEDGEISGAITATNEFGQKSNSWISIEYKDMKRQKLNPSQKTDLVKVLDTIKVLKNVYKNIATEQKFEFIYPPADFKLEDNFYRINNCTEGDGQCDPDFCDSLFNSLSIFKLSYWAEGIYGAGQNPSVSLESFKSNKTPEQLVSSCLEKEISNWRRQAGDSGLLSGREVDAQTPRILSQVAVSSGTVSALKITRVRSPAVPNNKETEYLFKRDDIVYRFYARYSFANSDEEKILNRLFDTFKFL